ncbi:hypothetical protein HMPREF1870_00213 [Bacteroidales bacterium KA00344]|nr:hypothetical protein HMPREF1870_00213 [Bacteroidales bacterium KA00344]
MLLSVDLHEVIAFCVLGSVYILLLKMIWSAQYGQYLAGKAVYKLYSLYREADLTDVKMLAVNHTIKKLYRLSHMNW